MDFVIIFGPPAVGKMTVGVELANISGLKLFHNHMTIDLVLIFLIGSHLNLNLVMKYVNEYLKK